MLYNIKTELIFTIYNISSMCVYISWCECYHYFNIIYNYKLIKYDIIYNIIQIHYSNYLKHLVINIQIYWYKLFP